MLNISDELRQIYKGDIIPNVSSLAYKQLNLYFPELDLTITNDKIVDGSFRLEESLCSSADLSFGACESAQIKITVADITQDLKGQIMVVSQTVNNTYTMPLGTYKVESAKKQSDLRFKDIVAYDNMTMFDADISSWYNSLTFPMALSSFRASLCSYIGITCVTQTLPNDTMTVTKTITPTTLSGRDVLKKIGEINGCFGHITRDNKLKFIGLSAIGLYPSEDLYPAEDLFPSENSEYLGVAGYKNSQYEEYTVQSITSLQIREQEGDVGVTVGSGDNCYIVQDNFLTFGKNTSDLTAIANNLLPMIKNKTYRPHTTNIVGLPYLEVGDTISIVTNTDVIETFVLKRTITGIQALNDEISASGSEKLEQATSISQKIEQLNSKQMKLKADVDGLELTLTGEGGVMSQLSATADQISAEVRRAQGQEVDLAAAISLTANGLSSKVSRGDVVSEINQSAEQITLNSNRLVVNSTNFQLDSSGHATFSGNINGASITGTGFTATTSYGANVVKLSMSGIGYTLRLMDSSEINVLGGMSIDYNAINFTGDQSVAHTKSCSVGQDGITYNNGYSNVFVVNSSGVSINGSTPITVNNISSYIPSTSGIYASTRASTTVGGSLVTFSNTSGSSDVACASYVQAMVSGTSDERLKKNIKSLSDDTDKYMQLNPIEWDWVLNDGHDIGLGAHELSEIYPEMVRKNYEVSKKEKELCPDGVWEIKYKCLHAKHIRMIQKHEIEMNSLIDRVNKLEQEKGIRGWIKRIRELIGRINRLQQQH